MTFYCSFLPILKAILSWSVKKKKSQNNNIDDFYKFPEDL